MGTTKKIEIQVHNGTDFDVIRPKTTADIVDVADSGNYFTGTNTETVLQEVGLSLAEKANQIDLNALISTVSNNQYKQNIKNIYGGML